MKTMYCSMVGAATGVLSVSSVYAQEKPNIVFILADDQGCTDLSGVNEYSSKFYSTPAIANIAKESVVFNHAYAEPVCAPTRADLMTGLYPSRHHIYTVTNPKDKAKDQLGRRENNHELPLEFTTIASVLKNSGYTCVELGKWHLGKYDSKYGPRARGFDITFGGGKEGMPMGPKNPKNPKGGHYWAADDGSFPFLSNLPANGKSHQFLTHRLTEEALKALNQVKGKPFFLYLPYYAVHGMVQSPDSYQKPFKDKPHDPKHPKHTNIVYAGLISILDEGVGKVWNYLIETDDPRNPGYKLIDNTMFIYMSDNGGVAARTDNAPFKGGKACPYEGGVRVPLIIHWKNYKGTCDTQVHAVDFFPTFVAFSGGDPAKYKVDGVNILPLVKGNTIPKRPLFRHQSIHGKGTPSSTILKGDYKLILHYDTPKSKQYKGYGYYEFYNLKNDMGESKNIAENVDLAKIENASKAIIAERDRTQFVIMARELNKWLRETKASLPYIKGTKKCVKLPDTDKL